MSSRTPLLLSTLCLLLLSSTSGALADETESFLRGGVASSPSELTVPATFKVVFFEPLDLHKMHTGTEISGRLKEDLKVNKNVVAPAGSIVTGYVQMVDKKGSDAVGITEEKRKHSGYRLVFDEIILSNKERLKVQALPIETISVFNNKGEFRSITVGPGGVIKKVESLDVVESVLDIVVSRSMVERGMYFKRNDEIEVRHNYLGSERVASKAEKSRRRQTAIKKQITL
ncbi:MAG: hypothetical protein K2Y22_03055 [Candidatus Obscuribacterales bacterium]|nr:hypothetical protein [Candidatus Obscuribacterales bacterium]